MEISQRKEATSSNPQSSPPSEKSKTSKKTNFKFKRYEGYANAQKRYDNLFSLTFGFKKYVVRDDLEEFGAKGIILELVSKGRFLRAWN